MAIVVSKKANLQKFLDKKKLIYELQLKTQSKSMNLQSNQKINFRKKYKLPQPFLFKIILNLEKT